MDAVAERAPDAGDVPRYTVDVFNPARNTNQRSRLRIVNPGPRPTDVCIGAHDDAGSARGDLCFDLQAGAARHLSASELEQGFDDDRGSPLGAGADKWRLEVRASTPVLVMSLLQSPGGLLTNLSAGKDAGAPDVLPPPPPPDPAVSPAFYQAAFTGRVGSGGGAFYVGNGQVLGTDTAATHYSGGYSVTGGRVRVDFTLRATRSGSLVTGDYLRAGDTRRITGDWPDSFDDGNTFTGNVSVGGSPVTVFLTKVGAVRRQ